MFPIYIIIPVHNRRHITLTCLGKLESNGDLIKYRVVVVDDGSSDGTSDKIQSTFPEVTILYGDGNLWWTGAIALGMNYAASQQAKFVIWLNDDCILEFDTLSTLINFLYSHPKTIAGAVCYSIENQSLEETGAQGRRRVSAKPGEVVAVNEISGYCVGIPIEVMKAIGVPNQSRFPHYYGDCTYILKANRAGFAAYILGDVKVSHHGAQPSIEESVDLLKSKFSIANIFREVFFNKKSPYLLKSTFFYYLEKYGSIQGFFLFLIKTVIRIFKIIDQYRVQST